MRERGRRRVFQRADGEVAATVVLQGPGPEHLGGDMHHCRNRRATDPRRNALGVVHAVLQVQHDGVCVEVRCDLFGGGLGVGRLHAEEDEARTAHRVRVDARLDRDVLVELEALEVQAGLAKGIDVQRPADQRDLVPCARQHAAVKAPDGAGAENRDAYGVVHTLSTTLPKWLLAFM